MGQLGFFDIATRYADLDAKNVTFPLHSGPGCKLLLDHLEGRYERAQDLHG